jgi:hypothetical protein
MYVITILTDFDGDNIGVRRRLDRRNALHSDDVEVYGLYPRTNPERSQVKSNRLCDRW